MKVRGKAREITVTQRSLADAIGLTPPRISQLIQEGVVIRDEKDKSGGVLMKKTRVAASFWYNQSSITKTPPKEAAAMKT